MRAQRGRRVWGQCLKKVFSYLLALGIFLGLNPGRAQADFIDFVGAYGGTVSYDGLGGSLVGVGLPIISVFGIPPGYSSAVPITGGTMSFTTGNFVSSSGAVGAFTDVFGSGGTITITGEVPDAGIAAGSILLSGTFSGTPTFSYNGIFGSMNGALGDVFINPALFTEFGFTAPFPSGFITQLDIAITPTNAGPGTAFSGSQSSANIAASTPEPASLLLLGSGLLGLGFAGRKRLSKQKQDQLSNGNKV